MRGMFYRILEAPPGYPPEQGYLLVKYRALNYESVREPPRFFATIEDARAAIPNVHKQLPFDRDAQFIELWETSE